MREKLRAAVWIALVVNLVDLTTSLIPSPVDQWLQTPARSPLALGMQLALAVPLLLAIARRAGGWAKTLASLNIPRAPLIVAGAFIAVELVHIALRLETFPFSPVAMYSNAVATPPPPRMDRWTYVIPSPGGHELISPERESTPFGKYLPSLDYKVAAAVTMYTRSSVVFRMIRDEAVAQGFAAPVLVNVVYDTSTGAIIPGSSRAILSPDGVKAEDKK